MESMKLLQRIKDKLLPSNQANVENKQYDEFVCVANKAADAAAAEVKKFFWNPEQDQTFDKFDKDGVIVDQYTAADIAAEKAMVAVILKNFPDHVVFSEECGWLQKENQHSDYVWVLDPIDGTDSFKNKDLSFGTLIALVYKNEPILGIIDQPIMSLRWVGVRGRKTTLHGRPECWSSTPQTRPCECLSQATLYADHPSHFSNEKPNKERMAFNCLTEKVKISKYGAGCYTYGLLASGFNDVIVQSYLDPYDFLAFIPIIEGAGGIITDWAGEKLQWKASPMFKGPPYYRIIAAGDARVHQDALEHLNKCEHLN